MDALTLVDVVNLFVSAISIVLAIVALWLSLYFYRQSKQDSLTLTKASDDIAASVTKLEKLFDSLYSDTFSMMRDTVTDMRSHIWRNPQSFANAADSQLDNANAEATQIELMDTIESVSRRIGVAESKLQQLRSEVSPAVARAIDDTGARHRSAEWRRLKARIVATIAAQDFAITLRDLRTVCQEYYGITGKVLISALFELESEKRITWQGAPVALSETEKIFIVHEGKKGSPGETSKGGNVEGDST